MKSTRIWVRLLTVLVVASTSVARADLTEPAGQALGFYAQGKLAFATALPAEGEGFTHLFRLRDRGWSSQGMIDLIVANAREIATAFPGGERLQIGDLSARHGGPVSGHASHQNGLDGDLVYYRVNHLEQDPAHVTGFAESFVIGGKISANFDLERSWSMIKLFSASGRLNRIFVDPVIKHTLCVHAHEGLSDFSAETTEALRRLRPLTGHDDHMHVRLTCPVESPRCVKQEELPAGDDCQEVSRYYYY